VELLRDLAKCSLAVSNAAYIAEVRQCGSALWLDILSSVPWGLRLVVCGWYFFILFVSCYIKLVVGGWFGC
jgi:hypothetical protein